MYICTYIYVFIYVYRYKHYPAQINLAFVTCSMCRQNRFGPAIFGGPNDSAQWPLLFIFVPFKLSQFVAT